MRQAILVGVLAGLVFCGLAAPADAQTEERLQGIAIVWENDFYGLAKTNTDRWYSNGMHGAWSYRRGASLSPPFVWVRSIGKELGVVSTTPNESLMNTAGNLPAEPTAAGFIGHNIYTPTHIRVTTQQIYDRPYAGLLTFGIGSFAYCRNDAQAHCRDAHRALDLRVGVVGPGAFGERVQTGFHKIINNPPPEGWALQVRPRLALQASYMHTERFNKENPGLEFLPRWAGIHWHGRVTAGTVKNLAATGVTFIAGERDRVFGAPDEGDAFAVDFNERTNYFRSDADADSWLKRVSLLAQFQVAGVASNYLITGKTYGPQPQIQLKHGVWMATLGASVKLGHQTRMEFRLKRRSVEFTSPFLGSNEKIHSYGELRYVWDFDPKSSGRRESLIY